MIILAFHVIVIYFVKVLYAYLCMSETISILIFLLSRTAEALAVFR